MEKNYTNYPCGKVPKKWQRPELDILKEKGYKFDNPQEVVGIFENKIAKYAGSKYAVAVDSCTDGLFMCLKYTIKTSLDKIISAIIIPQRSYCSVPMLIINAGFKIRFEETKWKGIYKLKPFKIYDSATRFTQNMYKDGFQVLSFQYKKRLPIGKGGMILTNNKKAKDWLDKFRYEGRNLSTNQWDDEYSMIGWNMYMDVDSAARGILLFDMLMEQREEFPDFGDYTHYPDLSKKKVFKKYTKGDD